MSYLPRAPTQGAAVPVHRDATTPLPRSLRPDEESKLTYKPSQLQWVKLAWDAEPDAGFYAGRSVQIYAAEPITPSPTQYGGQTALWRRDDYDTLYRFQKRVKIKTIHIVETPFSVAHIKLLTKRPGRDNPLSTCKCGPRRYPMNRNSVFYLSEKISVTFNQNIRLEVPMYHGVTLSRKVSLNQRPGDPITDRNPNNMYYTAEIYIETEEFGFEPCRRSGHATVFEQLDQAKVATLMSARPSAVPRVLSAHEVPVDLRRYSGNSYIKDLRE